MTRTFVAAAILLTAANAAAQPPLPIDHEKHFYGVATCTGLDVVVTLVTNWENGPIYVTNEKLVFIPNDPVDSWTYIYSGINDQYGDIITWEQAPASGTSFTGKSDIQPGTAMRVLPGEHVDYHAGCTPVGIEFQTEMIVHYLLDTNSAPSM